MINYVNFKKARPVFPTDDGGYILDKEMNIFVGFYAMIPKKEGVTLRIAGSSTYTVFVNGKFVFSGPARTAHGYYRVDEIPLDTHLTESENAVVIKLSSYNVYSTAYINVPGFLCAEIECGDDILSYTDEGGTMNAVMLDERIRKVFKWRNFTEAYRLDERSVKFFTDPANSGFPKATLALVDYDKKFIPRNLFVPTFDAEYPTRTLGGGVIKAKENFDYHLTRCPIRYQANLTFDEDEMEFRVEDEIRALDFIKTEETGGALDEIDVDCGTYKDFAFDGVQTGFIEFDVEAEEDSDLFVMWDELYNGRVNPLRTYGAANCIALFLKAGKYHFASVEPQTMQYISLAVREGKVKVSDFRLRLYCYPEIARERPKFDDPALDKIYDAAIETFRQNTVDVFMDCPGRERGGWLCDGFFTGRVEKALVGNSKVEREFLFNYIVTAYEPVPDMLPMVYPSDRPDTQFIPNWAMWFVIQLDEYLTRSGDTELVEAARDKVMRLLRYFKKLENSDGLLEKLESWVFLEWSRANDLVQDINYPSNATYAKMKRIIARLYDMPELIPEAEKIEKFIRDNTMVNGFFCDNSVLDENGVAHLSGECTETCQYYAFYMDVATPETYPKLWNTLLNDFGPDRVQKGVYPEIAPSNAFIGNYLRLDLLARYGELERLENEIKGYFLYMAEKTGTLWEMVDESASCNHGFASHVIIWLDMIAEAKKNKKK